MFCLGIFLSFLLKLNLQPVSLSFSELFETLRKVLLVFRLIVTVRQISVWQFQSAKQWIAHCASWMDIHLQWAQYRRNTHTHTQRRAERHAQLGCLICEWTVCSIELPPGWDCVLCFVSFAYLFASMGPLFHFNYMNLNCALRLAPLATV